MFFQKQNSVAREEIFAPVVIEYDTPDDAVHIANDTPYGLRAHIAGDSVLAKHIVGKIRAGTVFVNSCRLDFSFPFGGYKQSENGRDFGEFGLEEFLKPGSVRGDPPADHESQFATV